MDILALRSLLRPAFGDLKDRRTNTEIPEFCRDLGLPIPDEGASKRERLHAAFDALADRELPLFAQRLLDRHWLTSSIRNEVQDLLWQRRPRIEVNKRHRREIARALQHLELFGHWEHFKALIEAVFVIEAPFTLLGDLQSPVLLWIQQHFVRNPEDADVEALFETLEVFGLSDHRFQVLLEGLVSADVQVDVVAQTKMVAVINGVLRDCGAELRPTREADGYPVFELTALHSARGRPKNLIFASKFKPDIRFRDAINNDIEIASNPDEVLVFDRPISGDGLLWRDLQAWWSETTGEADQRAAKKGLYQRLLSCLPIASPPQRLLFTSFFKAFGLAVPDLPALLPEVWLHWDPKTVTERGPQALLTHRMDFLMLLPGGARVVLEVDGKTHYSDDAGRASPAQYGRLAAGDRELKLAGYEVYRFGGAELNPTDGPGLVGVFFEALFKRYGLQG